MLLWLLCFVISQEVHALLVGSSLRRPLAGSIQTWILREARYHCLGLVSIGFQLEIRLGKELVVQVTKQLIRVLQLKKAASVGGGAREARRIHFFSSLEPFLRLNDT